MEFLIEINIMGVPVPFPILTSLPCFLNYSILFFLPLPWISG
jgi:hypothetical protein